MPVEAKVPVTVVPSKRISTGFSLPPTTPDTTVDVRQAKQGTWRVEHHDTVGKRTTVLFFYFHCVELAVEEASKQMGHLRTPGATLRSTSPSERETVPKPPSA